jgi:cation transport ATPase
VVTVPELARRTLFAIRDNLFREFIYNMIFIATGVFDSKRGLYLKLMGVRLSGVFVVGNRL